MEEEQQAAQEVAAPKQKKLSEFGVRCITGAVYFLILIAFFALKLFVWVSVPLKDGSVRAVHIGTALFDILLLVFVVIGTFEMLRAFRDRLTRGLCIAVMTSSVLLFTVYAVSDFLFMELLGVSIPETGFGGVVTAEGRNYSLYLTFGTLIAGVAVLFAFLVFSHGKISLESLGAALSCFLYPTVFLGIISVCNHLERYSEFSLLLIYIVAPFADSAAYTAGKLLGKKFPAKMAPNISPKKTIVGGIGGLLGGAIGAIVIFFGCYGLTFLDEAGIIAPLRWELSLTPSNALFFLALGILTAAFSQFGDLVESAVKRKLGIKDMGKLLPGHGGILDRIDSTLYAGLIVSVAMVIRIMIFG